MNKHHRLILLAGFITGLAALGLTAAGNPANMGFCIAIWASASPASCVISRAGLVCTAPQRSNTYARK